MEDFIGQGGYGNPGAAPQGYHAYDNREKQPAYLQQQQEQGNPYQQGSNRGSFK